MFQMICSGGLPTASLKNGSRATIVSRTIISSFYFESSLRTTLVTLSIVASRLSLFSILISLSMLDVDAVQFSKGSDSSFIFVGFNSFLSYAYIKGGAFLLEVNREIKSYCP